jgi:hypothetical protein
MDPRAGLVGSVVCAVGGRTFYTLDRSFILRAAVFLTNKVLGCSPPSDLEIYKMHSGYPHGRYSHEPAGSGLAVPSTGRAMGILLIIGVVDFVVRCGILMAAGAGSAILSRSGNGGMGGAMAALISLPVSILIHIAMLSSLLPTTLGRAFLVLVFQFLVLIMLLIVLLFGALMLGLMVGKGRMH